MSNVGYATVSIIPSAKGFGAALDKQIGPGIAATGSAGGKKAGKGFKSGLLGSVKGIAGPLAATMGLAAVGGFLASAVGEASDLNEVGTALKVVFGDGLGAVEAFGNKGAKALGMSKLEALNAAQSFGVYGKAAGLSGKANAGFSTTLAGLGADLASFYNSSPEEAIAAIGSGLRGEAEPLRKFGILLDDATLKAQAMKMGLISSTKDALSPQNKVLAANASILAQSKIAQGDFAKTSGGLANQQRILSAQFTDLKGKIGGAFLPSVLGAVKGLNGLFDSAGKGGGALSGLGAKFPGLTKGLSDTGVRLKEFGVAMLGPLKEVGANIMGALGPGIAMVSDVLTTTFLPAFRQILPILIPVGAFIIRTLGSAVVGVIKGAFNVIAGVLKIIGGLFKVIASAVKGDWSGMWQGVKTIASGVMQAIKGAIQVFWNIGILGAFRKIGLSVLGSFKGTWKGITGAASSGMASVKTWINNGLSAVLGYFKALPGKTVSAIGSVASTLKRKGTDLMGGMVSGITGGISSLVRTVGGLPGKAVGALSKVGTALVSAGGNLIAGFVSGIRGAAGNIVSAIRSSITDKIPQFVRDKLGIRSPSRVFMEIGGHVGDGMAIGIASKAGAVTKAADGLAYTPTASAGASLSAAPASSGGDNVFHLYDADGALMGTMRGAARTEISSAARGVMRGTR